jgi:predicted phosphoadenosine phosphosulfate sulfurtransferase
MIGLTSKATYKWITWGNANNKKLNHYTFYPLYDWSYRDIWKSIFDHSWDYCKIYDYMYQYGVRVMNMRVSNVHHETAIHSLFYLQEIEADNWNRITKRIHGISTAGQTKRDMFFIKDLPYMFVSWTEYRDYLLENLISDETIREIYRKEFASADKRYCDNDLIVKSLCMIEINSILANDYYFTKLNNWKRAPQINSWLKYKESGKQDPYPNLYIDYERFKKTDKVSV